MNEITFSQVYKDWRTKQVVKTYNMCVKDETLGEIIEDFEMFLKGCGYVFPDGGRLDICFVDDFEPPQYDNKVPQMYSQTSLEEFDNMHSSHFFDTQRNK